MRIELTKENESIGVDIESYPYVKIIKRKASNFKDYTIRRRTLNVAIACVKNLKDISFEELTTKMFFVCSKEMRKILSFFESLLYECILDKDNFYKSLHDKLKDFSVKVREKKQLGLLVEFNNVAMAESIKKDWKDEKSSRVFSAYLSLLQQSITYFYDDLTEYPLYYVESTDSFVTIPDRYPMIDYCVEEWTVRLMEDIIKGKSSSVSVHKKLREECFKKFNNYGMNPKNMNDVDEIFCSSNNYGNMLMSVLYYMNENTKEIIPKCEKIGAVDFEFPRVWYDTEYLLERLKRRNFALPPETVKVVIKHAKGIKEIWYNEVVKDGKIIVLYKVIAERAVSRELTDFVGYYIPSEKFFFSYYEMSQSRVENKKLVNEVASSVKNYVLENYFLLTVRRTEEEKTHKKYSIPLIASEYEDVEKVPRWKNQPIVFTIMPSNNGGKEDKGSDKKRNVYRQGIYEYSDISIGCIMRKLPKGFKASEEAIMNAEKYGYELEEGYTFVVPFERKQRHIKVIGE